MKKNPSYFVALKRLEKLKEKIKLKDNAIKYALEWAKRYRKMGYVGAKSTEEILRGALK